MRFGRALHSLAALGPKAGRGARRGVRRSAWLMALAALLVTAVVVVPMSSANAAGAGVLNVTIAPVDSSTGANQANAAIGQHQNEVAYLVGFSCCTAACTDASVDISAPQADPGGLVPASALPTTLLAFKSWTPPFAGATMSGDDATVITVALGNLTVGISGTYTIVYSIPNMFDMVTGNNVGAISRPRSSTRTDLRSRCRRR